MLIPYRQEGDYQIPDFKMEELEGEDLTIYGLMRMDFLKTYHTPLYIAKLLTGEIYKECLEFQKQAEERDERITKSFMEREGVNEALKAEDQMEWVKRMTSIRARVMEIMLNEMVFVL